MIHVRQKIPQDIRLSSREVAPLSSHAVLFLPSSCVRVKEGLTDTGGGTEFPCRNTVRDVSSCGQVLVASFLS